MAATDSVTLLRNAEAHWAANEPKAAVTDTWQAFLITPGDPRTRRQMARLLKKAPSLAETEMGAAICEFLRDPSIEPMDLCKSGWMLRRRIDEGLEDANSDQDLDRLAARLECDDLALTLLQECPVIDRTAEKTLTRLRRRLALSGRWTAYPNLIRALAMQAKVNGGAWPFEVAERNLLAQEAGTPFSKAYFPDGLGERAGKLPRSRDFTHNVTRAVAGQYEGWPYPVWNRISRPNPSRLPDVIRKFDPITADNLPIAARILVAGCGTGRQAAYVASRFPDALVTAIDISDASLDYARRQCVALGIPEIRFQRLDLHEVSSLGETFDAIYCAGVLHHLPDPEAGWAALHAVLKPGGIMHIAIYSRLARMGVQAARSLLGELMNQPVDDDLLRTARAILLARLDLPALRMVLDSNDFSTLVGTHDLLFHRHEDPFDVPRIERAMKRLGLRLLHFDLPSPAHRIEYSTLFPGDPLHRDFRSWNSFEFKNPGIFASMYHFWCAKPFSSPQT